MSSLRDTTPQGEHTNARRGLSDAAVAARRAQGLVNTPVGGTSRSYGEIIRTNTFTPLHNLLFGLSIALIMLGRVSDAVVTIAVVFFNLLVGIVQEIRAKRQLDQIALLNRPTVTAIRDGVPQSVNSEDVVVDDVLQVSAGDQIVADGEVAGPGSITVDESLLSGESDPVAKAVGDLVAAGSFVVTGSTDYTVTRVGDDSTAGRLTASARRFTIRRTPIQRKVALVIQSLLFVAGYLLIALLIVVALAQIPLVTAVRTATVIAGLVPNGLLLAVSVAYALSAVRLAGKGVVVQQANAVESLSNVDMFCLDKTGTLTANRMEVRDVTPLVGDAHEVGAVLGAFAASGSAPNSTSRAILAACPAAPRPVAQEVPFSSARKWSALRFDDQDGHTFVLGAPEMLLPAMAPQQDIERLMQAHTAQGLRVLLFASSTRPLAPDESDDEGTLADLRPIALVSIGDELRPDARQTLQQFTQAGVTLKIISGDNPETVAALARQAGLSTELQAVSGVDLEAMDDHAFNRIVREATVFGRITPHQKQRIVATLRRQGHYVAMAGDGVNDVLSLKEADLGIAMEGGSQATRAVADMVLLNNSFAALPAAVTEGQRVVNGIESIIKIGLARMIVLVLFIMLASATFPLTPKQNAVMSFFALGVPSLALAAWAKSGAPQQAHMARRIGYFVLPVALLTSLFALLVYSLALTLPGSAVDSNAALIAVARSAVTTFLIVCSLLLVLFVAPPTRWWAVAEELRGDGRIVALVVGLLGVLVAMPLVDLPIIGNVGVAFDLLPLSARGWAIVGALALVWVVLLQTTWRTGVIDRLVGGQGRSGDVAHPGDQRL